MRSGALASSGQAVSPGARSCYGLDNEPFHLVEATVPRSFAGGLYGGTADRMAFRSVDAGAQLDELTGSRAYRNGTIYHWWRNRD
jgi:hypothetical protein